MQVIKENPKYHKLLSLITSRQQYEHEHPELKPKTDYNFRDIDDKSLLDYAIEEGNLTKVRYLIEQLGASVNIVSTDGFAIEPIEVALKEGQLLIAQYLFDKGAKCYSIQLHSAATAEVKIWFSQKIKEHIELNVNLNIRNDIDNQFFNKFFVKRPDILWGRQAEIGNLAYFEELKKQGKLKEIISRLSDPYNYVELSSPLTAAALNGHIDLVRFFLSNGFPIQPIQENKISPLHNALLGENIEIIKILIMAKADIEYKNQSQQTALLFAVQNNKEKCVEYLLTQDPNMKALDNDGNNVLHLAIQTNNLSLLNLILLHKNLNIKKLLEQKNIFGISPLQMTVQSQKDAVATIFEKYLGTSASFNSFNQIDISQNKIIKNLLFYFKLNYRNTDLFNVNGLCNGLSFLYLYYCAKKMKKYFYQTLTLLVNWDGENSSLYVPFENIPQAAFYKNLAELMEQWVNDMMWFQAHLPFMYINQEDRLTQFNLIGKDSQLEPRDIFNSIKFSYSEGQIKEIFHYFIMMPPGTSLLMNCEKHILSVYKDEKGAVCLYDPNIKLRVEDIYDPHRLMTIIRNYLFILLNLQIKHGKAGYTTRIKLFNFAKDNINYENFEGLTESQYPKNREDVKLFQEQSANSFTHLHIAVLTRSLISLKRLLRDGFCNVNSVDRFYHTALDMALINGFSEAIAILLEHTDPQKLNIDNLLLLSPSQVLNNIDLLIKQPTIADLTNAFMIALIGKNNLSAAHKIFQSKKFIAHKISLLYVLNSNNREMMAYFLNTSSKITEVIGDKINARCTPLEYAIKINFPHCDLLFDQLQDINVLDDNGQGAIHYAAKHRNLNIMAEIIRRGGKFSLPDTNGMNLFTLLEGYSNSINTIYDIEFILGFAKILAADVSSRKKHSESQFILYKILQLFVGNNDIDGFRQIVSLIKNTDITLFNRCDDDGRTILSNLLFDDKIDMAKVLLDAGADVNAKSEDGYTAVHKVVIHNYPQHYFLLLLDHGADLSIPDAAGFSAHDYIQSSQNRDFKSMITHETPNISPRK